MAKLQEVATSHGPRLMSRHARASSQGRKSIGASSITVRPAKRSWRCTSTLMPVVGMREMARVYLATMGCLHANNQILYRSCPHSHDQRVCLQRGGMETAKGTKGAAQGRGR